MHKGLVLLAGLVFAVRLQAAEPPLALADAATLPEQARIVLPPLDATKALAEDELARKPGLPLRYAIGHTVATLPGAPKAGLWSTLPDGRLAWRLALEAPGAVAVDLGFDRFRLPHGAELWLVGVGKDNRAGPYTDAHNPPGGGAFWLPRVSGARAELQLVLPATMRPLLELELGTVNQAYRDVVAPLASDKSGSCNVDVACPEG